MTEEMRSRLLGMMMARVSRGVFPKTQREPVGYLTFASAESFTIGVANATKNWDGTLYYSTDTSTWNEWDGTATISSVEHGSEQKIYMRGSGNSVITDGDLGKWVLTGTDIRCVGNIENLLDYETVASDEHPSMTERCYSHMFYGCTSLIEAPDLPATTLTTSCYDAMFCRCTRLTEAPDLPATTLANSCYYEMFYGCTSLTQAPDLPATTLTGSCYNHMFYGCTNLTKVPEFPATTLAGSCCYNMFRGCISLKISATQTDEYTTPYRIPTSGTATAAPYALDYMFTGTSGTFKGTPSINTTYYLHNSNTVI